MIKGKLIKTGGDYLLRDMGGDVLAITKGTTEGRKLSKKNCDDIFGVIDVEKLATGLGLYEKINFVGQTRAYKAGFQKAMELNKDKLFTLEDIKKAMDWIMTQYFEFHEQPTIGRREQYLESIQQPTEIEVEIEMEEYPELPYYKGPQPKLDSEGCLILKINKPE